MDKPKQKESVKSPSSATDPANMGGLPPKWDVEKTFSENLPPTMPAQSSVIGIADKGGQGTSGKMLY